MNISENRTDNAVSILVSGRLDTTTAPQLESKLKDCSKGIKNLNLNLQDVEYISSAGLRVVLLAHKLMTGLGGKFTVQKPSEFCMQVFQATGMDSILKII
ncbi:MAG: STAS domain-containing protein [Treponema sp.]|nr:STAS domain-containing protein [Treponema sp.]